jgi:hypothetical protein
MGLNSAQRNAQTILRSRARGQAKARLFREFLICLDSIFPLLPIQSLFPL